MPRMLCPILIRHESPEADYTVVVPDLPGCTAAGRTLEKAMEAARKAIVAHMKDLIKQGKPIPDPRPMAEHEANPDYRGGTWVSVIVRRPRPIPEPRGPKSRKGWRYVNGQWITVPPKLPKPRKPRPKGIKYGTGFKFMTRTPRPNR